MGLNTDLFHINKRLSEVERSADAFLTGLVIGYAMNMLTLGALIWVGVKAL